MGVGQERLRFDVADRIDLLRPTLERAAQETHQLQLPAAQALNLFKTILNEQEGP